MIWLNPGLCSVLKQSLLSISANALKSCMMSISSEISFESIHKICKKMHPHPNHVIPNFPSTNEIYDCCSSEHAALLSNIVCMGRQLKFEVMNERMNESFIFLLSRNFCNEKQLVNTYRKCIEMYSRRCSNHVIT